ncbi:MAG: circularly permuted type 2 ATP-grasp protein [bacterium]|nr:circularly permuted type 2 ATP-grasp protein [bacterium]
MSSVAPAFDEVYEAPGRPRPHWENLTRSLTDLGWQELNARRLDAARLLRQNGVTYNVYADSETHGHADDHAAPGTPEHPEHPWKLDPIPLVIAGTEWAGIEAALLQRGRLLDLIVRDLYGPGDLLRRGLIPPAAVYSHPGFLRGCVGAAAGVGALITVATDLVRQANGGFLALSDRAQAPSGAGYALENRIVLARTLPDIYRDSGVSRLAVYFRTLRETLAALTPRPERREDPRIVVLTPGPGNETYFEHAFLASYLGYTLVEGNDLTVRDGRVWVQTIDGRDPVDVILRRLDDVFLDPLELKPDSLLGTPGLLQAIRMGGVAVVNPPGSGVLDNPALLPYLPAICKHLLGESLKMDSVPTHWCGDPAQREYVLANLPNLIVKSIYPKHGGRAYVPDRLSAPELEQLRADILRRPYHYVGQERIALSTLPYLSQSQNSGGDELLPKGLETRPMILRAFLLARRSAEETAGDAGASQNAQPADFVAMPGGLTRVSGDAENPIVSNQRGGVAKDTWVLTGDDGRQGAPLLRTPGGPVILSRRSGEVASRVAGNLFWLGRYLERSDGTVRVLRETYRSQLEQRLAPRTTAPEILLEILTHLTASYPGFLDPGLRASPESELADLVYNPMRPGSLVFNLRAALAAGRRVRDRLSEDGWHVLNTFEEGFAYRDDDPGRTLRKLEHLAIQLAAFAGIAGETINHGQGWRFLQCGRRVERAIGGLSILRSIFSSSIARDDDLFETLLYMKDSLRLYRRRYQARFVESDAALDIMLLDEGHPQSIGYQIKTLSELASALPDVGRGRGKAERLMIETQSMLRLTELGSFQDPGEIGDLLARLSSNIFQFSDILTEDYLTQGELPRSVQAS